jgi:hypothetical protein
MVGTVDEPGPGRTLPICYAVDSLTGKSSRERQEKIKTAGSAEKSFPIEALKIGPFLKSIAHEFVGWPFAFICTNHLKIDLAADNPAAARRLPGGDQQGFQESLELETGVWKTKIDTAQFEGKGITLTCVNNALAPSGHRIKTRILWWNEQVGVDQNQNPVYAQKTMWDWDWATVTFLHELDPKYKKRLKEVAGFTLEVQSEKADIECMARSPALGMGKKEWLHFHEVGARIREDQDLCDKIRGALGIKRGGVLEGDYLEQLGNMAEAQDDEDEDEDEE